MSKMNEGGKERGKKPVHKQQRFYTVNKNYGQMVINISNVLHEICMDNSHG